MLVLTTRNLSFEFLHLLFIISASLITTLSQHQYFMTNVPIELMFRNTFFASLIGTTLVTAPITFGLMSYYTLHNIDLWTHPNIRMQSIFRIAIAVLSAPTGIAIGGAISEWPALHILQTTLATIFGVMTVASASYLLRMFGSGLGNPIASLQSIAGDHRPVLPGYTTIPSATLRHEPRLNTGGVLRPLCLHHMDDDSVSGGVERRREETGSPTVSERQTLLPG